MCVGVGGGVGGDCGNPGSLSVLCSVSFVRLIGWFRLVVVQDESRIYIYIYIYIVHHHEFMNVSVCLLYDFFFSSSIASS